MMDGVLKGAVRGLSRSLKHLSVGVKEPAVIPTPKSLRRYSSETQIRPSMGTERS